jgi:hypothetical protein
MTDIDWSKAPEGYPIWITDPDNIIAPAWHKETTTKYIDLDGGFWNKLYGGFTVHIKPSTWNGTGLPPVGTVCEVYGCNHDFTTQFNCKRVEIILNDGELAVFRVLGFLDDLKPRYHALIACKFRPIRTPEQIAEDERGRRVRQCFCLIHTCRELS